MKANKITISAKVEADLNTTWIYYTQPEHITKWNFAADTWHCPNASNDLRPGGRYLARMEARDGSFGFDFAAVYDLVKAGEKLVYTLTDGRQVVVDFTPLEQATEVTVCFDAEDQNPTDLQRDGWQAILNNFKRYTETSTTQSDETR